MKSLLKAGLTAMALVGVVCWVAPARGEIFEEIVAWVNGDIITSSDMEKEEQMMIAEAYRRYTGEELDRHVKMIRETLLIEMIDRKILLDRARAMFTDLEAVKDSFYDGFKQSQDVTDDEEFARILEQEGMTVETFKERLLELYAPDEVLRLEVASRISISDKEIEDYYNDHLQEFTKEDQITVREIVLLADTDETKQARKAEAEAIVARVQAGEEFAELAKSTSDAGTKSEGGMLGALKRGELSEQLEIAAFELVEGEISAPIETPYGYHILMVEEKSVGERTSLEDIRDRLRLFLEDQKYREALQRFREKIRAEAEWCVREKYNGRLLDNVQASVCGTL